MTREEEIKRLVQSVEEMIHMLGPFPGGKFFYPDQRKKLIEAVAPFKIALLKASVL